MNFMFKEWRKNLPVINYIMEYMSVIFYVEYNIFDANYDLNCKLICCQKKKYPCKIYM